MKMRLHTIESTRPRARSPRFVLVAERTPTVDGETHSVEPLCAHAHETRESAHHCGDARARANLAKPDDTPARGLRAGTRDRMERGGFDRSTGGR